MVLAPLITHTTWRTTTELMAILHSALKTVTILKYDCKSIIMNEKLAGLVKELEAKNIEFRLVELTDRAMTVKDVIKFSKGNLEVDEICKTIIWETKKGLIGVFLKGDTRINLAKLQKFLNAKVTMASSEEVKEKTGLEPGAVCPLLLGIPLVMDKDVFDLKKANFGSGDHLYGIEMNPGDILNLTHARIAKLSD